MEQREPANRLKAIAKSLREICWDQPGEGRLATVFYRIMFPPILIGLFAWVLVCAVVLPLIPFVLLTLPFHDWLRLDWEQSSMFAGVLTFYLGYWAGRRGLLKSYEISFRPTNPPEARD